MKTCDVLILGTGIAGLSLALQLNEKRPDLKIVLMTKNEPDETNTSLAQGGIAAVCDRIRDSFDEHIQDTLNAGQGKCNPKVVEMVIKQAPHRLQELIKWGAEFDTEKDGHLAMALEGGHSHNRVVHYKDKTGWHIQEVLWTKIKTQSNIEVIPHAFCVDLLTEDKEEDKQVIGMSYIKDSNPTIDIIFANTIVLATGGSGQVFQFTSNPEIATGDGVALAFRAGASIKDMHYVQFHPTALYEEGKSNLFLISEAVRGFGGYIVNKNEERFLFEFDSRGELATRDIVSKAITNEIEKSGNEFVYLDLRHLNQQEFQAHFPTIYARFIEVGLYPESDLIPIVPVAHYQCGGIEVNENGQTSLKNLYALGECSCTGLHGANRLASNSLLEALVFSFNASERIIIENKVSTNRYKLSQIRSIETHEIISPSVLGVFKNKVKCLMNYSVLHGTEVEKQEVIIQLTKIHFDLLECVDYYFRCRNCCELENMLQTSLIIMNQSLNFPFSNNLNLNDHACLC